MAAANLPVKEHSTREESVNKSMAWMKTVNEGKTRKQMTVERKAQEGHCVEDTPSRKG